MKITELKEHLKEVLLSLGKYKNNTVISGGCIVSLIRNEKVK